MARQVSVDGWGLHLPDAVTGGELRHSHTHCRTMALYRGPTGDGCELEVIVTTYPGTPIGEHGERLDREGTRCDVPGAQQARRQEKIIRLEIDPGAEPVESIIIVATAELRDAGSVCVVVHRPLGAPSNAAEAVVASLTRDEP